MKNKNRDVRAFISVFICLILVCLNMSVKAQTLTNYEYWFDNNINNRTTRVVTNGGKDVQIADSISLSGFTDGLHLLTMRFLNSTNRWSTVTSYLFFKTANPNNSDLVAYDYWFDGNINNRIVQNLVLTSQDTVITGTINTSSLATGTHTICMRYKDAKSWSCADCYTFNTLNNSLKEVAKIPLSISPNPANANITISFELTEMKNITCIVTDVSGKQVFQKQLGQLPIGRYKEQIELPNLANGIWFVALESAYQKIAVTKFVVQR